MQPKLTQTDDSKDDLNSIKGFGLREKQI